MNRRQAGTQANFMPLIICIAISAGLFMYAIYRFRNGDLISAIICAFIGIAAAFIGALLTAHMGCPTFSRKKQQQSLTAEEKARIEELKKRYPD